VSEAGYDLTKFKVFICYHEKSSSNTKGYAKIISDILGVLGVTSFVAHLERNNYSERFDEVRKEILTRFCKYFIFINTHGSLDREQIEQRRQRLWDRDLHQATQPRPSTQARPRAA